MVGQPWQIVIAFRISFLTAHFVTKFSANNLDPKGRKAVCVMCVYFLNSFMILSLTFVSAGDQPIETVLSISIGEEVKLTAGRGEGLEN